MILRIGLALLCYVLCLFLPAATLAWFRGWLFFFVMMGTMTLVSLYLRRVNPDVLAGRINRHEGTKHWDQLLTRVFLLPAILAILIVAALDDGRFHWFPVPWWVCVLGYALLISGMVGVTWAESVNKFFEPTVRIQTDRGHNVIDSRSLCNRPTSRLCFHVHFAIRHAPGSWFPVGIDPCRPVLLAPCRADGPGRPDPSGRIARLQGLRPANPLSVDSWVW